MSAPAVSGHLSAVESDPLDAQIDKLEQDLEAMLAPLHERRAELEVELMELATKEERIEGALRALGGRKPKPSTPRTPRAPRSGSNAWTPSADVVERVHAALRRATDPITVTALSELTGVSRDTVNRSVNILRENEQARLVGTEGRGNARVYLAMTES